MRFFITGASGFIGWHVTQALLARGHHVLAGVRGPSPPWLAGTETVRVDFARDHRMEDWLPRLHGVDAVVNAVGIIREGPGQRFDALHFHAPAALFRACAEAGVQRVVQLSALGADAGAETAYHLSKRAADEALMELGLDWYVLRPSLVYGPRGGSFTWFRALAALPLAPLPEGGRQMIQPIHIDDLTRAVVQCVEGAAPARRVIHAVGPEPLSLRKFLGKLRTGLGLGELRVLPVPHFVAWFAAGVGEFTAGSPLTRASLRMLRRGNQADVRPFRETFGFTPRAVTEALAPPTQAESWHAGLYFLRPLLRLSIACTWLSAGLVSAFFYSSAESYALLQSLNTPDALAPLLLYGAAGLDCVLGLTTLSARWVRWAGLAQITVMLGYTAIISVFLAEYWLHPFGPVVKNLPLSAATLVMLAMEKPECYISP